MKLYFTPQLQRDMTSGLETGSHSSLKLYTEEQVLNTVNAIQSYIENFGKDGAQPTIKNHLKMLAPISLPSDEEIDVECRKLPYEKHIDDGQYNDGQMAGFELGAYWMRQQILNQNK